MSQEHSSTARQYSFLGLSLLVGLSGWIFLVVQRTDLPADFFPYGILFIVLSLFIKGFWGPLALYEKHSLVGIVDVAAVLLFGPVGGAWVAGSGALLYQAVQGLLEGTRLRKEGNAFSFLHLLGNVFFDSGLKVIASLISGWLYVLTGGQIPLVPLELALLGPAALLFTSWFALDHLGWVAAEAVLGKWRSLQEWLQTALAAALLIELLPLPLSLLVARVYQEQTLWEFLFLSAGLVGTSVVIQLLFAAGQRQRRMLDERALLNEVTQAIVQAELSVDGLCELIYQQASRVVDTSSFHLGLFEGEHFILKIRVREGIRMEPLSVSLSPGEGIIGWMQQSKESLLVRDFLREMADLPARPRYISEHPPRSAVFVPFVVGKEVIGSLSIQNPRPAAFTTQHLRILSFIADQSSLAITKARLYQAAQERAVELARIAQENAALYAQMSEERDRLELVYDVARDLTRRLDVEDLLLRLLQRTVESVRAEEGTILLLGKGQEPPWAITLHGEPGVTPEVVLEKGLAGWVVCEREGVIVADVKQDSRWLPVTRPVGSAVVVPICHQDTALGAMTLTHSKVDFFTSADLTLLTAIGEQAAVALEASHLYEAQRRRAVQLQTIAQIMRSILSILDLDQLLVEVVDLVRDRFGYAHAHILTMDSSADEVHFRASTDPENPFWETRGGRLKLGEGLVGWVAQHGEAVVVGDVRQDARWLPDQTDVRSEVAVPLKVAGEVVGVLDVQSEQVDTFDEEDLFVLRTLANQIAVALESARLYAAEQEEAWVLNALLQVAQNIARARALDELLEVVVRLTPLLIGVERNVLFLRDRVEGSFQAMHGYGAPWRTLAGARFEPGEISAFERVVRQAGPVVLVGSEEQAELPSATWGVLGEGAVWLFPLIVGGEVSGILLLCLGQPGIYLSGRQRTILAGITHQAGIAIEEARLRQEVAQQQRLEQELAVARELQERLLPACCPRPPGWSISATWQSARQVGGDFYDFIDLPDGRLGFVVADVSDKGVPAALFMVLSRSLVRASAIDHPPPSEALLRANDLLLKDTQSEMFVSVFYAVIDLHTGEVQYASAGHNPPLLCRRDGQTVLLEARGVILGVIEDIQLEEGTVHLEPGDTLVLYTDGVTETINGQEEEFGLQRLLQFIQSHRAVDLPEIQRSLLLALQEFSQGQPPFDDTTLVLVRREEP